jgi:hypothetical protein
MRTSLENRSEDIYEQAKKYFDLQLINIGLTEKQILEQSLEELNESLVRVNDALQNPESFGVLKLSYSANASFYLVKASSDHHHKFGILPILLERKKLIIERIRELSAGRKLESLQDLISEINDDQLKNKLSNELLSLQKEANDYSNESRNVATKESEEKLKIEQEIAQQQMELLERKTKIWQSYLQRESVATIVGGMILITLTVSLIIAMFAGIESTEIINNGFLVILGYFFGQAVKSSNKNA